MLTLTYESIHLYLPTMRPVWPLAGSYGHFPFPSSRAALLRVNWSAFCKHTHIHTQMRNTGGLWSVYIMTHMIQLQALSACYQHHRFSHHHVVVSHQHHVYAHNTHKHSHIQLTQREILFFPPFNLFLFCLTVVVASGRMVDISSWHLSALARYDSVFKETSSNVTRMHTYHIGAFGLEGIGTAGVEERVVIALQEADVVEAFGLWRREEELLERCSWIKQHCCVTHALRSSCTIIH